MTIYAIVVTLNGGYKYDKETCKKHNLQLNKKYEVLDIDIGQSRSTIQLLENNAWFNSIYFEFEENNKPLDIYSDPRFNLYVQW